MKLLLLIHRLPCPPDRGAKLRSAIELRYLAARHDVWCAGFVDSLSTRGLRRETWKSLVELNMSCCGLAAVPLRRSIAGARALGHLLTGRTATEGYFASLELERQVLRWSREVPFDAVLAFSSSMAPLAKKVPARRHVLDLVDLDSRKWAQAGEQVRGPMRWVYRTEATRLAQREEEWMSTFDASVLVNQREADLLNETSLRDHVHVIETGASLDLASQVQQRDGQQLRPLRLPDEPIVGFVGAMDYGPNADAAVYFGESIWPLVQQHRPDSQWWIVGRSPTRAVCALDDGQHVRVTGTVPEVEPYLAHMRVTVAPLRLARGVQTKVLMAMEAGRPCVVTSCVAEGIGAEPNREIVVADTPKAFADAVAYLLNDRDHAEAIGRAGRTFVAEHFSPMKGLKRLESLLCGTESKADGGEEPESQAFETASPVLQQAELISSCG